MTVDDEPRREARGPRVSVAFCPSTPLLVPAVAGRATAETAALREACTEAVGAAMAADPEVVVVVGAAPGIAPGARFAPGDAGSLRGFGVPLDVPFGVPAGPGGRPLPLAHTVGAWLLAQAGCTAVPVGVAPGGLAEILADPAGRTAVLAVGGGSARRTVKAPGYLDPAAEPFDDAVAAALAAGDAAALAALDPDAGERLLADGVPAWRAVGRALAGRPVRATLRHHAAPFGVGYLVADWAVG